MQDRFKFRFWHKKDNKMQTWEGCHFYNALCNDYLIPMQCTGLKDKNGKLIYEGDILEILHSGNKKAVVCWNKTNACYELQGEAVAYNAHITIRNDYFEIVGNIYENPELLEVKNDR